jgi:hypothetical protein
MWPLTNKTILKLEAFSIIEFNIYQTPNLRKQHILTTNANPTTNATKPVKPRPYGNNH